MQAQVLRRLLTLLPSALVLALTLHLSSKLWYSSQWQDFDSSDAARPMMMVAVETRDAGGAPRFAVRRWGFPDIPFRLNQGESLELSQLSGAYGDDADQEDRGANMFKVMETGKNGQVIETRFSGSTSRMGFRYRVQGQTVIPLATQGFGAAHLMGWVILILTGLASSISLAKRLQQVNPPSPPTA
jgi:hypothetical protein